MLIIVDFAIIKGGNIYCFSFLYNKTEENNSHPVLLKYYVYTLSNISESASAGFLNCYLSC